MNNTKNTISWCDFSWNPVVGCRHSCWYCYAKRMTQRFKKNFPNGFEPTFHPERVTEIWHLKNPSKIFVCSIADLFAPWTNVDWTNTVLAAMHACPIKHIFQMLTKNPERIMMNPLMNTLTEGIPENWWFGTTVTGEPQKRKRMRDVINIDAIKKVPAKIRFVSFEPLLGNIDFKHHSLKGIQWVIIGKLTGSKRIKLQANWVVNIIDEADRWHIPVFIKNNILLNSDYVGIARQEFP